MKKNKSCFIAFEGIEGAGKSSAITVCAEFLSKIGQEVIHTREPGGTVLADKIRALFADVDHPMSANTELLLLFASRQDHIDQVIAPALAEGKWVLSDRFIDATYAYQGGGRGVDISVIAQLDKLVCANMQPDRVFLLDIPETLMAQRLLGRGGERDRIESEKMDFFQRVRKVYLERAQDDPERYCVIDATQPQPQVLEAICQQLEKWL